MSDAKLPACAAAPEARPDAKPERVSTSLTTIVADLLAQSREAHRQYRQFAGSCDKKGNVTQPYDEGRCVPAVERALSRRLQAHDLDPEHTDPAWDLDTAEHEQLVEFYRKFLK